jgi:hypothetical protein
MPMPPLDLSGPQRALGVRTRQWASFSPFCKFIAPQGMLMLQSLCDHAMRCGYTPLAMFLNESSWANLMCLDEQSCLFVLGAAQNHAVLADVHGVNLCVSQMAGSIMRQTRLPTPACRELFEPPPRPVSRTDATVGGGSTPPVSDSDSDGDGDGDGGEPKESPDAFLVRTHIRRLGIGGKDARRLGERALAIGRRSFLRAVKELTLERPPAKSIVPALSRIMTRYEC